MTAPTACPHASHGSALEIEYALYHEHIPPPTVGFGVDWREVNAATSPVADQRACPGIRWREGVGITLYMPYSVRFGRAGKVEVTHVWGPHDARVYRFEAAMGRVPIKHPGASRAQPRPGVVFPGCALTLPQKGGRDLWGTGLGFFLLGDLRLDFWGVHSGVLLGELPPGYEMLVAPLPNHRYPAGYSVGQAVNREARHLKIPIDLHFEQLPAGERWVAIERGTPMVQYLVVRVPPIRLTPSPALARASHARRADLRQAGRLAVAGRYRGQITLETVPQADATVLALESPQGTRLTFPVTGDEARVLRAAVLGEEVEDVIARNPSYAEVAQTLVQLGLIEVLDGPFQEERSSWSSFGR
jgi:hypothetical protein